MKNIRNGRLGKALSLLLCLVLALGALAGCGDKEPEEPKTPAGTEEPAQQGQSQEPAPQPAFDPKAELEAFLWEGAVASFDEPYALGATRDAAMDQAVKEQLATHDALEAEMKLKWPEIYKRYEETAQA